MNSWCQIFSGLAKEATPKRAFTGGGIDPPYNVILAKVLVVLNTIYKAYTTKDKQVLMSIIIKNL